MSAAHEGSRDLFSLFMELSPEAMEAHLQVRESLYGLYASVNPEGKRHSAKELATLFE